MVLRGVMDANYWCLDICIGWAGSVHAAMYLYIHP